MKRKSIFRRGGLLALASLAMPSCMTTYDYYGNPVQTVDPSVAVAGVAAAGVLGYALANDHNRYSCYGGGYYCR